MKLRPFKILSGVSLLLCVATTLLTIVLLGAGFWRFDHAALDAQRGNQECLINFVSSHGGLGIEINHWWELSPSQPGSIRFSRDREPDVVYPDYASSGSPTFNWYFMGFQLGHSAFIGANSKAIVIPEPVFSASGPSTLTNRCTK